MSSVFSQFCIFILLSLAKKYIQYKICVIFFYNFCLKLCLLQ